MNADDEVSVELLNAFVDNELDAAEKSRVLERIAADAELRARVCELWQLKEMVRGAYPEDVASMASRRTARRSRIPRFAQALAATVVLTFGAVAGWLMHGERDIGRSHGFQLDARQVSDGKIILHLASGDSDRIEAALDEAEMLAKSRDKNGHPMQVELIANGTGLDLLRTGASPYAQRIAAMHDEYANLSFLACNLAIENLRARGVKVNLLPQATIATSALDQIMMRLKQGWLYLQV